MRKLLESSVLANRFGCRTVLISSSFVVASVLPMLAVANDIVMRAISLAVFGAAVSTLDVAINIQAVMVEKDSRRDMTSGFHGLFSLGGILGSGGVSILLRAGLKQLPATFAVGVAVLILAIVSHRGLLPYGDREAVGTPLVLVPRGIVIFIGFLCFIVFLAEGAILDWSALFLIDAHGLDSAMAGFGYAAFAIAMTVDRLTGDQLVRRSGGRHVLVVGGPVAGMGFVLAVVAPTPTLTLPGFFLVGLGASNIVPVLFTAAGAQTRMPASLAIAPVTTIGYAGILMSSAAIGGIAQAASLGEALLLIAAALAFVAITGPGR